MNITFAARFWESLKGGGQAQTWPTMAWEFFTRKAPRFVTNVWRFRAELLEHDWWDYHHTLTMLRRSLTIVRDGLAERGIEVEETRLPKVAKITRAIEIIDNFTMSRHLEMAEAALGEIHPGLLEGTLTEEQSAENSRVYELARRLEKNEWAELFRTLEGQDPDTYDPSRPWVEWFDGSGMRGWWD
jgi:hypothetical protein